MSSIGQSRSLSLPISCDETKDLSTAYPARCSSQNDAIISATTQYEYSQKSLMVPPSIFLHVSASNGKGKSLYCCVATKAEHDGPIVALAVVGNRLYCASGGGINVRNHPEFSECNNFGSGVGPVKSLLVNGKEIFSTHQNNKIQVWHYSSKDQAHYKRVATIPTAIDYLSCYISDKKFVQVRRHHRRPWMEHADAISAQALSMDGFLYSESWDRFVKVWKLPNFKCIETFKAHDDAINTMVVAKRDGVLYTGSADGTINVWMRRPEMGKHVVLTTLKKHASAVNALALSSDWLSALLRWVGWNDSSLEKKGTSRVYFA